MTYGEFIKLGYDPSMPMESVLAKTMYDGTIDFMTVMTAHHIAVERRNHLNKSRFNEACINLVQLLSQNFEGEDLLLAQKRAIHTLGVSAEWGGLWDSLYGYTEEDKKKFDEEMVKRYGLEDFNNRDK